MADTAEGTRRDAAAAPGDGMTSQQPTATQTSATSVTSAQPPASSTAPVADPDSRPTESAAAHPHTHPTRTPGPPPADHHRDVSGGWLRPAVFGAMDGLVTNVSLISGVGAGGASAHAVALTGLAGLVAGALSMATGEYVSVSSQNELVNSEVEHERRELDRNPIGEQAELAATFRARGVEAQLAAEVARQISAGPDRGLDLHVREELGVDHEDLPSPWTAAGASFASFCVGAIIPLFPYLIGAASLALALVLAAVAALVGGGLVGRLTGRSFWRGALRQLALGVVAAGVTFLIGRAVGTHV